ncbi:ParB/RepB/Spo0J family partition protein [Zoogloea oleivorans]|uniref:ParB/RepB/Spo0J family partition protein n=1 Tax=Zoogloea oleivorans TaxID=1552750 RepID=UPI001FE5B4E0|nr:ParB/RepB/Spo0J family partition protein [Zoogloea oleivorans]
MNAITKTEARAINTAAPIPLEAADPSKNLILVPLSRLMLRPTGRNVRKTPRMSIPELAASIQRVGLLQNLIVITAADGEHYEVVAGGRRLAALKLLAKKHRIPKEWEVPCLLVADGTARTASLTENVQREAMHPADQFEAFAALVAEGRPIEDIAADFSVTPLVVQRRLKLANVSPRLMTDYRADAVTLDQLMALSITDDHAAQEGAFYDAPTWQRQPSALRERLTEREIDAYRHPQVRFVGLDAYESAGGGVRRDLFAEGDAGVYLTDAALLERLAQDKLAGIAAEVKAEGWAWVDATPGVTHADLRAFQRAPRERREPSKREAQRIEKLQTKMQEVGEALDAALDAEDEDKADSLQEEGEALGEQLQALEDGLQDYGPNVKATAGAIVTIDRNGEAVIHRGLLGALANTLWLAAAGCANACRPQCWRFLPITSRKDGSRTPPGIAMKLPYHASTPAPLSEAGTLSPVAGRLTWPASGSAPLEPPCGDADLCMSPFGGRFGPRRPWLVVNPGGGMAAPWASRLQPSGANNFPAAARLPRGTNSLRLPVLHCVATASGAARPSPAGRITTRTRWARTLFNRKEKTSWPTSAPSPQTKMASPARCAP